MNHLHSDHLRTFLAILEAGSVTGGAQRINRSQSATSLQIKQLEEIAGQALFHRHGRGVTLTDAGERLLPVARRVTNSLDATLAELRGEGLKGKLRIGLPDDHSRSVLTRIVSDFAAHHPEVELEVQCALGAGFEAALQTGALDLAVHEVPQPAADDEVLRQDHLSWLCRRDRCFDNADVLPVAVFDRACWWRDLALSNLDALGRRYRVVFTSESVTGIRAAVSAGIAVGLLNAAEKTKELLPIPDMALQHASYLVLQKAHSTDDPVCDAMCTAIRNAFRADAHYDA